MISDNQFGHIRSVFLWFVALVITGGSAAYQRMTGPSYPVKGVVHLGSEEVDFKLGRSHGGEGDQLVRIPVPDSGTSGTLFWKRYKTTDDWTTVRMEYKDGAMEGTLPHQPKAGKLSYRVALQLGGEEVELLGGNPVVTRFKGETPLWILIPHIALMFMGMLVSARAALALIEETPNLKMYAIVALVLLGAGGFILGPIMQKYAFDAFWTGYPFGTDLTDNKTALAIVAWAVTLWALLKGKTHPKMWVLGAALVTFSVFLVPHSMFGSELDYSKPPVAAETR